MPVLADTGILIEHLRSNTPETRLTQLALDDDVYVSVISVYEVEYGAARAGRDSDFLRLRGLVKVIRFDEEDARVAGQLRSDLLKRNHTIALPDLFIATTALRNDLPIATLNFAHFERIPGIRVV